MNIWTISEEDPEATKAPSRPDCPGCGEPDLHGDDFCHECGHAFAHFGSGSDDLGDDERGQACPMCATGELSALEYGRAQCDQCGYTPRDEG